MHKGMRQLQRMACGVRQHSPCVGAVEALTVAAAFGFVDFDFDFDFDSDFESAAESAAAAGRSPDSSDESLAGDRDPAPWRPPSLSFAFFFLDLRFCAF